jgi:hypothetical protein
VVWTVEQVLGLAPDAWAARAARDLAVRRKWQASASELGRDVVWGEYQGSAAQAYRVAVDLSGPAFACSCPSRKSPCKHALGLMLLAASDPANVPPRQAPEWLTTSLPARRTPVEARPAASPDQEKRASRREQRISDGVEDLQRWLEDLVRTGLAEAATRPWSSFEQISARLVDAQAPGLARLVRDLGSLPHNRSNWPERMLIDIGQLSLLLQAWRRRDALEPRLQAEVRAQVGISEPRELVLSRKPVEDTWDVLGRRVLEGERMRVQRTWLYGRTSKQWALLLDFSVAGEPIDQVVSPGLSFEAPVYFYAGALPLRALVGPGSIRVGAPHGLPSHHLDAVLTLYASMLGANPWLERAPMALRAVLPRRGREDSWCVFGEDDRQVPIEAAVGWQILALSGGVRVDIFGEWDGFVLVPLSVWAEGKLVQLRYAL